MNTDSSRTSKCDVSNRWLRMTNKLTILKQSERLPKEGQSYYSTMIDSERIVGEENGCPFNVNEDDMMVEARSLLPEVAADSLHVLPIPSQNGSIDTHDFLRLLSLISHNSYQHLQRKNKNSLPQPSALCTSSLYDRYLRTPLPSLSPWSLALRNHLPGHKTKDSTETPTVSGVVLSDSGS